jgi:hypothetical protein
VYGWREPAEPSRLLGQLRGELGQARRALSREHLGGVRRLATLGSVTRHHLLRLVGALLGSRADSLPSAVRGRLSLERRASFAAVELDAAANLPSTKDLSK